jgi:hypothetical protein
MLSDSGQLSNYLALETAAQSYSVPTTFRLPERLWDTITHSIVKKVWDDLLHFVREFPDKLLLSRFPSLAGFNLIQC